MMKVLVVGASGATGRLLVEELLRRGHGVKVVVRSVGSLPEALRNQASLSIVPGSLLDLGDDELARLVGDCAAVASCLGHNLTLKGIYGSPHRLVTSATRRLCEAIRASQPHNPVRFVLMNTAGNSNRDLAEPLSLGEKSVLPLIRLLLPPHRDNEMAADYLRTHCRPDDRAIQWAVVRPDSLIHEPRVSEYAAHPSPTRSPIFNAGKTSRINVAHFMAALISEDEIWSRWQGQMPVIYNNL